MEAECIHTIELVCWVDPDPSSYPTGVQLHGAFNVVGRALPFQLQRCPRVTQHLDETDGLRFRYWSHTLS